MRIDEHVPLSTLTTFRVGGTARAVATCKNEEDIKTAVTYARDAGLPWYVLGGGSNVLASDDGYDGVIIRPLLQDLHFDFAHDIEIASRCVVTAGAGVVWDTLVQESVERELWGLENLAGIPGLVGGAPVQNIGAYGADASDTLLFVDAFNTATNAVQRFTKDECDFSYRESRFKHDPTLIILRAAFSLKCNGSPRTDYADLAARIAQGELLTTASTIAIAVRAVRSKKFPDLSVEGTAGSFFKNPIISTERYEGLAAEFPGLPGFAFDREESDEQETKVPLAWILDHVLHLKGFKCGPVRLFENQPIVVVAESGATAQEVDALAREVEQRVFAATGITLEREVRSLVPSSTTNRK
jgi:UDP-N-acetylmuramate dehydrogenase